MPPFPKPKFPYKFVLQEEIAALGHYRDNKDGRSIPKKSKNRLLVATWNIANLGLQKRKPSHYRLIAELISWFDMVAARPAVSRDMNKLEDIVEGFDKDSWDAAFGGEQYKRR